MDQSDELSLWLAGAWLRSSGNEIQSLIVEDLEERVMNGMPLSEALASVTTSKRQAGDFGMEIAGTLLAPVIVEFLKTFWASYLKTIAEQSGKSLAVATTEGVKRWFLSAIHKDNDKVASDLRSGIADLATHGKVSPQEADRLIAALTGPKLSAELGPRP